jgi:hypothetical protein
MNRVRVGENFSIECVIHNAKQSIYLEATGGLKTVVNGRRSFGFEGLFKTCRIVI